MASNADNPSHEIRYGRVAAVSRGGLIAALCGSVVLAMTSGVAEAADPYAEASSFSGFYVGVLGQYSHADASFRWSNTKLFDDTSDNWGVNGVVGYGWRHGSFYIGPEIYVDYANQSNSLLDPLTVGDDTIVSVSLEREIGAGSNLLAGFTGFNDNVLFYGLAGVGATNFAGKINIDQRNLTADIWYPVLSAGAGIDWKLNQSLAVRLQARHTFYIDVSDHIFPANTDQSYNFDTTSVSMGLIWHPWK